MLRVLFILLGVLVAFGDVRAATPDFCLPGDPAGFNPAVANDEATHLATRPIYDHLVELRAGRRTSASASQAAVDSGLAEFWNVSHDGRTYTFQLRRNVRFHQTSYFTPTRPLNADDVLFSFNRQRLSAHPFHHVGGGNYPEFVASNLQANLAQVERVNDHSVRFHLNLPDPDFLAKLARDVGVILSAEYGENLLSKGTAWEIDQRPVGTGPFAFQKYERGKSLAYVANAGYFRGRTTPSAMRYTIVPSGAREEKVRAGQCSPAPSLVFP